MDGTEPNTLRGVARWVLGDPWDALGRRWNYKSAVLSAVVRGQLFFFANLSAGPVAALNALGTEMWFRFLTAGFYGALTQAFRRVEPTRSWHTCRDGRPAGGVPFIRIPGALDEWDIPARSQHQRLRAIYGNFDLVQCVRHAARRARGRS
jgi:hypothetical protein